MVLNDYYLIWMLNLSYLHFYLYVFPLLICQIWWCKWWKYDLQCLKIHENEIHDLRISITSCFCVDMIRFRHTQRYFQLQSFTIWDQCIMTLKILEMMKWRHDVMIDFSIVSVGESMIRNDFASDSDWHEQEFQKKRFFISQVSYPLRISFFISPKPILIKI